MFFSFQLPLLVALFPFAIIRIKDIGKKRVVFIFYQTFPFTQLFELGEMQIK